MKTFEEIYAENYTRLYRLAHRMLDDAAGASDVVQDVFMALYERMLIQAPLYMNTWLYRAVINKSLDQIRRKGRFSDLNAAAHCQEEGPGDTAERNHLVQNAMALLAPSDRALLILYSEGFSYKEIAECTGIRFTSVGKTLSRALDKMEKELKKQGYEMH